MSDRIDGSSLAALDALGLLDEAERLELEQAAGRARRLFARSFRISTRSPRSLRVCCPRGPLSVGARADYGTCHRFEGSASLHPSRRRMAAASDSGITVEGFVG